MQFNRLKSKAYAKSKEAMADLEVEFEAKDEEKLAGYVKEITEKKQAMDLVWKTYKKWSVVSEKAIKKDTCIEAATYIYIYILARMRPFFAS